MTITQKFTSDKSKVIVETQLQLDRIAEIKEERINSMKVEIRPNVTVNYVEELGKCFDMIVEDGKVYLTSIYSHKRDSL